MPGMSMPQGFNVKFVNVLYQHSGGINALRKVASAVTKIFLIPGVVAVVETKKEDGGIARDEYYLDHDPIFGVQYEILVPEPTEKETANDGSVHRDASAPENSGNENPDNTSVSNEPGAVREEGGSGPMSNSIVD